LFVTDGAVPEVMNTTIPFAGEGIAVDLAASLAYTANLTGPVNEASPATVKVAVGVEVFTPNRPNESKIKVLNAPPLLLDVANPIIPGIADPLTG
jgi:hypothetical protein